MIAPLLRACGQVKQKITYQQKHQEAAIAYLAESDPEDAHAFTEAVSAVFHAFDTDGNGTLGLVRARARRL